MAALLVKLAAAAGAFALAAAALSSFFSLFIADKLGTAWAYFGFAAGIAVFVITAGVALRDAEREARKFDQKQDDLAKQQLAILKKLGEVLDNQLAMRENPQAFGDKKTPPTRDQLDSQ